MTETIMKCADCEVQDTVIPFGSDTGTKLLCMLCYTQSLKGKIVECECCPNKVAERAIKIFGGNMKMCVTCHAKELVAQADLQDPIKQEERLQNSNDRANAIKTALEKSKEIDNSIEVRTDLFNADTVAIVDLKKLIDEDVTIQNKDFALAQTLMERFEHFKSVVFEASETIVQATNNQKAIQVYLNQLANSLRAEERAKLKIQDINYKPKEVKPVKPRAVRTAKAKLDKVELRKYAAELGVSEFTLQILVVSKGLTVEQAANMLRKNLKESISESNPIPVEDGEDAVDMSDESIDIDSN